MNVGDKLDEPGEQSLAPIASKYLLTVNIPLYRDADRLLAGRLWFKDLAGHLSYLQNFTLACPVLDGPPAEESLPLSADPRFDSVAIVELPAPLSLFRAMFALPATTRRLWKAIRAADIVHTVVAGWPIPYGWIATPIAKFLKKRVVIIVESAPWRLNAGSAHGLKARLTASVYERLARYCLKRADVAIFTQDEYRQSLLVRESARGHVIHASWIDKDVIISDTRAQAIWDEKAPQTSALKLLFAGRLEPQKGVAVLLEAIKQVARSGGAVTLDVLGSGELADKCKQVSAELQGSTRVNVLGTVTYGPPLFELLQRYHAVVLPSVSDEQPRIVYDAYSQGVPVLGSRTDGLRDCIRENRTGWLVTPASVDELSGMILRAAGDLGELRRMGMEALRAARSMTHQHMHLERQLLLQQLTQSTTT